MTQKYDLVVTDFPWPYANRQNGRADAHYEPLELEEIAELMKLHSGATFARDCVVAMWVTVPWKWAAQQILDEAGLDYKTTLYWHKTGRLGTGYWFRNQVEELWVASRGGAKAFRLPLRNVYEAPVGAHSEKPEWFQDALEAGGIKVGLTRRLELFARRARPGWRCEGLELTGHDHREVLP